MGVEIRTQPLPNNTKDFELHFVDLVKLIPHEMTIEHALEEFKIAVVEDGILKHPLVLDKNSLLILDGHHRHSGLRNLGFKTAPAILIDYMDDDLITLDTWYPKIDLEPEVIQEELHKYGLSVCKKTQIDYNFENVKNREIVGLIGNNSDQYELKGDRELLFKIIREKWLEITTYYDDPANCIKDATDTQTGIVSWSFTKDEVVKFVKKGKVYLPKTTRHIINYLYDDCNYPLSKLE